MIFHFITIISRWPEQLSACFCTRIDYSCVYIINESGFDENIADKLKIP